MSHKLLFHLAALLFTITMVTSCVTSGLKEDYGFMSTARDDNVVAIVAIHNARDVEFQIQNKTDQPIAVDWDGFAYKAPSGESKRLIHSGVRLIDRNQPQARNTVAAKGQLTDMLVASDAIYYASGKYGGWSTNSWVPIPPKNASFTVAYVIGNQANYLECSFTEEEIDREKSEMLGQVTAKKTAWHLFFVNNAEANRQDLMQKARELAAQQYGPSIRITNPRYKSGWHVASLLMYFNLLGWVENASVTVDVIKQ